MKKYLVQLMMRNGEISAYYKNVSHMNVIVEANSEEEARDKAWQEALKKISIRFYNIETGEEKVLSAKKKLLDFQLEILDDVDEGYVECCMCEDIEVPLDPEEFPFDVFLLAVNDLRLETVIECFLSGEGLRETARYYIETLGFKKVKEQFLKVKDNLCKSFAKNVAETLDRLSFLEDEEGDL